MRRSVIALVLSLLTVQLAAATKEDITLFEEANQLFSRANETALQNPDRATAIYMESATKYRYLGQ